MLPQKHASGASPTQKNARRQPLGMALHAGLNDRRIKPGRTDASGYSPVNTGFLFSRNAATDSL